MVRSLRLVRGPRLLWPPDWCLVSWLVAASGSLEESCISCTLLYQSREGSVTPGETWMVEVAVRYKDTVGDTQRWCSPAGTVVTG